MLAAQSADQKKADDILLLDLRKVESGISDYVLILSATSLPHIRAIREILEETIEETGLSPLHREGIQDHHWVVLDYGGLVIHIFHQEFRDFYSLERLWEKAKKIPLQPVERKPKSKRKKTKRHG